VSNSSVQFSGVRDKNRFVGVKFKNSWYNTDLNWLLNELESYVKENGVRSNQARCNR
jgi:hypothetical protein